MFVAVYLLLLLLPVVAQDAQSEENGESLLEKKLVATRKAVIMKIDQCAHWRDKIQRADKETIEKLLMDGDFEKCRDFVLKVARSHFPDSAACIKSVTILIKKYRRALEQKVRSMTFERNTIEDFLSPEQLNKLHGVLRETNRTDLIENALLKYFGDLPKVRREQLAKEFFDYKKSEVSRLLSSGGSSWDALNLIADQFYRTRKSIRKKYERPLLNYCNVNLKRLIGEENFAEIERMYAHGDQVDHIGTLFQHFVANLTDEEDQITADHYGTFCRKVYRVLPFEHVDLTSWLSARQRTDLALLIQNSSIQDAQVYDKLYDYFTQSRGAQKDEADEVIDSGCRRFIARLFGDSAAEELEEMRLAGNVSAQQMVAFLGRSTKELPKKYSKKRAEESLKLCKRIYLEFDGSCDCNNRSSTCDVNTHVCLNCTDNFTGVQCEKCVGSIELVVDECRPSENKSDAECKCHAHSEQCQDGKCQTCSHNTTGDGCEVCAVGFYGDATRGSADDCVKCPCPEGIGCAVNEEGLVECSVCPRHLTGFTCDTPSGKTNELDENGGATSEIAVETPETQSSDIEPTSEASNVELSSRD